MWSLPVLQVLSCSTLFLEVEHSGLVILPPFRTN